MGHRYSIVKQCMQLLKKTDLPTINKLRIEILLIQLRRLLLDNEVEIEPQGGPCGESAFEALLHQMQGLCKDDCESGRLGEIMQQMSGVVLELSGAHS